jgi:hypothetical protein
MTNIWRAVCIPCVYWNVDNNVSQRFSPKPDKGDIFLLFNQENVAALFFMTYNDIFSDLLFSLWRREWILDKCSVAFV